MLADAGFAQNVKIGRERRWQLQPLRLHEARMALERIGQQWDDALLRLQEFVASTADV